MRFYSSTTHLSSRTQSEGLTRDLALWSSGLFPFFEYASTSVKPMLINLFETRYLPLQGALRPVMRAFILALLPGLEEEGGEWYDKVSGRGLGVGFQVTTIRRRLWRHLLLC